VGEKEHTTGTSRIGFVGCGYVSSFYMSTLHLHSDLELVGAFDSDPVRLTSFCEYYKTTPYDSLEELIDDCSIIVNLANPMSHFKISKSALERGVSVYSEKPLALSETECSALIKLAIKYDCNIFSAPSIHYSKMAETVKLHLDNKLIGNVLVIYAEMDDSVVSNDNYEKWKNEFGVSWPAKNEFESGSTLEHASYILCLLEKWFGKGELKIAFQNICLPDKIIPLHKESADFTCSVIEYPNNVIARVTCSIVAPKDHSIRIMGEKGVITIRDVWQFDSSVYWQNYLTIRKKTFLNPIKRRPKSPRYTYPLGTKSGSAQMDFCHGIHRLSRKSGSDLKTMDSLLNVNRLVLGINGEVRVKQQYSWIIIGTGRMAFETHNCLKRNGYTVTGIYSNNADRARDVQKQLGITENHSDLHRVRKVHSKTIAYVASINTDHYEQVKILLEKGYDVLCEKPITLSSTRTEELYQLADERGLRLQENMWSLFLPAAKEIKKQCENHDHVKLYFSAKIPYNPDSRQWRAEQGGCLYDLGIYPLSWSVYLLGEIVSFKINHYRQDHGVISEITIETKHVSGKTTLINTGFYKYSQYIKVGKQYFTPIYAPEFKSRINGHPLSRVQQKLMTPDYPAKDPQAYILDSLNSKTVDDLTNPHPPNSSMHVSDILQQIHSECVENL